MLKKYKRYLPSVRQIVPALTALALLVSLIFLSLTGFLVLMSTLVILAYILIFLLFGRNEYFSGRTWVILPIVVLTISFGFLLGLIKGYSEYARNTTST